MQKMRSHLAATDQIFGPGDPPRPPRGDIAGYKYADLVRDVWSSPTWHPAKQRSPRETRTFGTEAEAKIFARSRLDEGLVVYAGTINPHTPKRLVPSSQVESWLAGASINDESTYGEKKE